MPSQPIHTDLALQEGVNVSAGTSTGTKIGTATSQKLAFFNSTPIVQPSGDVATALSGLGLIASPTVVATTISFATIEKYRVD